jgi:hypothetical protein
MKVDAYSSSLAFIYGLLVLDTAVCAFGHGANPSGTQQSTELGALTTQFVIRVLLLVFTINLVAWAAPSHGWVIDALLSYKGSFFVHIVALLACIVLRVYRIMLPS